MARAHLALLAELCDRPLLITPQKARTVFAVLSGQIDDGVTPEASRFVGDPYQRDDQGRPVAVKPYRVEGGVGVITVTGSLVNRGAWVGASSGLTSYEGIQHQLRTAAADPEVESIVLDMDTPGGDAIGAMETAEMVRKSRKRTVALVNGMAASAGYAIASGANEIVTTPTGMSGSIGVVLLHADFSRQLDMAGIEPTLIFSGDHKVDGNPYEPLPAEVRDDLQTISNQFYSEFVEQVGRGRGSRLTAAKARATQARVFYGKEAVDAGLADRLGTFDSVLAELSRRPTGRSPRNRRSSMNGENHGQPGAESAGDLVFTQADADRFRADGRTAGATAERERFVAILGAEGIKAEPGRQAAAIDLACKSPGMSADDVVAFVCANVGAKATPEAEAPAAALSRRHEVPDSLAAVSGPGNQPTQRTPLVENMKAQLARKGA